MSEEGSTTSEEDSKSRRREMNAAEGILLRRLPNETSTKVIVQEPERLGVQLGFTPGPLLEFIRDQEPQDLLELTWGPGCLEVHLEFIPDHELRGLRQEVREEQEHQEALLQFIRESEYLDLLREDR